MPEDPLLWISLIIILLLGSFFSLTETAFAASNLIRIEVLAESSPLAKRTLNYLKKFDQSVIITVIGSNLVSVTLSTIATLFFSRIFLDLAAASLWATIIATFLFYIFCDTIPKSIARAIPHQIALFSTTILVFFEIIFYPLILIFSSFQKRFTQLIRTKESDTMTEEEFSDIVEQQIAHGTLEVQEEELIQSVIDFSETAVKDVLTPLEKIYAINEADLNRSDIAKRLFASPFSRIPIYRGDIGQIIGVISIRTFAQSYRKDKFFNIQKIIKKPYFVSSKVNMDDLFEGFKKQRTHIAIVLGNQKEVIGMVTMEDVLEEVIGQMGDTLPQKDSLSQ
jgi:CBS domain containing-hemolysin-like protein